MAKPFKITPTLKGKDAVNFHSQIKNNRDVKVDESVIIRIRNTVKEFKAILGNNK